MRVHPIAKETLDEVTKLVAKSARAVRHGLAGDTEVARDLSSVESLLRRVSPAEHVDRWATFVVDDGSPVGRPEAIPVPIWAALRGKSTWAYDTYVVQHYCSAAKLRNCYLIKTSYTFDPAQLPYLHLPAFSSGIWEAIDEVMAEFHSGSRDFDMFSADVDEKAVPLSPQRLEEWKLWLEEECISSDMDDEDKRTEAMVAFLRESFKEE